MPRWTTNIIKWEEVPVVIDAPYVARILRISEHAVRDKMISGEIPARKVGKVWRVSRDKLREWLEETA